MTDGAMMSSSNLPSDARILDAHLHLGRARDDACVEAGLDERDDGADDEHPRLRLGDEAYGRERLDERGQVAARRLLLVDEPAVALVRALVGEEVGLAPAADDGGVEVDWLDVEGRRAVERVGDRLGEDAVARHAPGER